MILNSFDTHNKLVYIYGLLDPRNGYCRYVGRTTVGLKGRLLAHMSAARVGKKKYPCTLWIKSLMDIKLQPEICELERSCVTNREESEKFWIEYLRFLGCDLLNRSSGGDGNIGLKLTLEARNNISIGHIGLKRSNEHRLNLSIALKGRKPSEAAIQAAKLKCIGVPLSAECKKNISDSLKGRVITEEHASKIGNSLRGKKRSLDALKKTSDGLRASSLRRGRGICLTSGKRIRWRVLIYVEGKQLHIGTFAKYDDALAARIAAEKKYWL